MDHEQIDDNNSEEGDSVEEDSEDDVGSGEDDEEGEGVEATFIVENESDIDN